MAEPAEVRRMTYSEYLEAEALADDKHEYLCGKVYAMGGGTPEHARLSARVTMLLGMKLEGRPCSPYSSDLRVRVEETDLTTYPDVSVVCGPLQTAQDDRHAVTNPTVLVEVLSDSSEAYDRGQKFAHYRRIPSLREYVLVAQRERHLEIYRREASGGWTLFDAGPGESVELASIEVRLETDDVYRDSLE